MQLEILTSSAKLVLYNLKWTVKSRYNNYTKEDKQYIT